VGGVEEGGARGEVAWGEELRCGDRFDRGVGDEPGGVSESEAEGFDDGVEVGGRIVVLGTEAGDGAGRFEVLEDAQGEEGDDALPVWWVFPDADSRGG